MKPILMLISSAPDTPEAQGALQLAQDMLEAGNDLAIFYLQDGVFHAMKRAASGGTLSNAHVAFYCLREDLEMRGFKAEDVARTVTMSDYDDLVDLMMERSAQTLGAF